MPVYVKQALINLGVDAGEIFTEVKHGEGEIDLLVFYRDRVLIFETKDRAVNLNDAYKLSAKTSRIESVLARAPAVFGDSPDATISKPCLLQAALFDNVATMSAVELAVKKVKKLSNRQARELLAWLAKQQSNGYSPSPTSPRKSKARRSMRKLKAWHDSIRFTTDWEPPRMPHDLVKPVRL